MHASVGGLSIAYDRVGEGEPVVLIMGLALTRIAWANQVPTLARRHEVITFDNRGVGESDAPIAPWSIADMVADTLGLMDALGIERAHVGGVSLGGIVAQETALAHPDRVRSLTLASTGPGGPDAAPPTQAVVEAFALAASPIDARRGVRILIERMFGARFLEEHPGFVDGMLRLQAAGTGNLHGVMNQMIAVTLWGGAGGSAARLGSLRPPTLVVHGGADEFFPPANAKLLASLIPGARLRVWPDAGHALIHECAAEVNEAILEHLAAASASG